MAVRAQKSLDDHEAASLVEEPIEPGGRGPHEPDMESRVAALELDMKDVKAGIGRLEMAFARSEGRMETGFARSEGRMENFAGKLETFATAASLAVVANDLSALTERLHAHGETLTDVKTAIRDLADKVDAKMVGGGQMFAIFAGLLSLFFVCGGIAIGMLQHLGLLH
jgi:hypothetical protein